MGLFTKRPAARNALLAAHRACMMPPKEQQVLVATAYAIAARDFRYDLPTIFNYPTPDTPVVFLNFVVYALGELGIQPAPLGEKWFYIRNPFVDCVGSGTLLDEDRHRLSVEHRITLPDDILSWVLAAINYRDRDFAAELDELHVRWELGEIESFEDYLQERDALIEARTKAQHGID